MKIIFASTHDPDPNSWISPLQQALPDIQIVNWEDRGAAVGAQLASKIWDLRADEPLAGVVVRAGGY